MNASIKGALNQIKMSYKAFTHKGKRMTKEEVKKVLEYGLKRQLIDFKYWYDEFGRFYDDGEDDEKFINAYLKSIYVTVKFINYLLWDM